MAMKVRQEYEEKVKDASDVISRNMVYPIEWFREELPLETQTGSCLDGLLTERARLGRTEFSPLIDPNPPAAPTVDVLVFSDNHNFCNGILRAAPQGRLGTKQVVTTAPDEISDEEVKQLLSHSWDIVIFGCGVDLPISNSVTDILKRQDSVTKLYFQVLQAIGRNSKACKRLVCLTCDTFAVQGDIHEDCGAGVTAAGMLWGLTNGARIELEMPIQYIDTTFYLDDAFMDSLASEVFRVQTFGHNTVRILSEGQRYVMRHVHSEPYEARRERFEVPRDGVVAITGGNGALAMVMAGWLVEKAQQQGRRGFMIKFLSRSATVGEANIPAWNAVKRRAEAVGIKLEQCRCDVSKPEEVDEFVKACSPKLRGIIHSAGTLLDGMLVYQTWQKFSEAFDGKARAALYLHDALERFDNPGLLFFWMFSSNAVYGSVGQTNYMASNSYLDCLARHRRALGKPGLSIQWGAWVEVGMQLTIEEKTRQRIGRGPFPPFTNAEGLAALDRGLATSLPGFMASKANAPIIIGISQTSGSANAVYAANMMSKLAPMRPPHKVDEDNVYRAFHLIFSEYAPPDDRLVYDQLDGGYRRFI